MKKEIELHEPFMNSNPYLSIFFSFAEVNNITITWLLKFFTGIYAFTKNDDNEFDIQITGFVSANLLDDYFMICCPFVDICIVNQKLILSDIKSVLVNAINNDYCIAVVINPQFISEYGNIPLNEHDLLIKGYDLEQNSLFVKDFFQPTYKYVTREIPYDEFLNAFKARDSKYNLRFLRKRNISDPVPTENDLKDVLVEVLHNIVNNNYTVSNPYYSTAYKVYKNEKGRAVTANNIWYGLNVYYGMLNYIDRIPNKFWIMLSDSKKLIYYALTQLENYYSEKPIQMYKTIIEKLTIILNLNIKSSLTNNQETVKKMSLLLCEVRDIEKKAINMILNSKND